MNADQTSHTAVVIPAYNEEATIRGVAERALEQLPRVIVVDDGSTDATVEQLQGLPIVLLRNERNSGKAATLQNGLNFAVSRGARAVITLDGDGQHRPEDIPSLLATGRRHPDSLAIAARLLDTGNAPRARLFANRFADFWISWAGGRWVQDSQSGFRLYPAKLIETVKINRDHAGFVFESEIIIEALRHGFGCEATPIASIYRHGARKSHFRPIADITRIVLMVAGKLFRWGFYPRGLWRALKTRPR